MKSLGSGNSNQSTALTIKQYLDLHGEVPSSLMVTTIFKPGKFDAWGLICEDRIKISIPVLNPIYAVFQETFIAVEDLYTPFIVVFDSENVGSYEMFDASDDFRVTNVRHIGNFGWSFTIKPINPSDNLGDNPDARRKKTAPPKSPK